MDSKTKEILQKFSTQKVELAIIDDVNSLYEKGFNLYDVQSELLKAQNKVKKSKNLYDQSFKKAEEGIQYSKEIGASDFIKLFQRKSDEAKSASRIADNLIAAIDKAITIL
tara:strand:- start:479 stop:811 length:333 start_codon:yes stop_codon:yes gene_type:complete